MMEFTIHDARSKMQESEFRMSDCGLRISNLGVRRHLSNLNGSF